MSEVWCSLCDRDQYTVIAGRRQRAKLQPITLPTNESRLSHYSVSY